MGKYKRHSYIGTRAFVKKEPSVKLTDFGYSGKGEWYKFLKSLIIYCNCMKHRNYWTKWFDKHGNFKGDPIRP